MTGTTEPVQIGLLGCGTIGSGVFHLVKKNAEGLAQAAGRPLAIRRILVKSVDEERPFPADTDIMVTEPDRLVQDPEIDIFIEVIGGVEPARSIALEVLGKGRHLVTANKELIARNGAELMAAAAESGSQFKFEASVGGGIPILRPLEESLRGDNVKKVMGIVNGTTNYILSRMSAEGSTYSEALAEAQKLGYAEPNPEADVEGADAASKLAILSSIAFKVGVTGDQVFREGIEAVRQDDIENAAELGYGVKLLAIASLEEDGISARVHPTMIPLDHPLAGVGGNFNAVFVMGEAVGELMFYGQGAGSLPTATAILGDVVDIARNLDSQLSTGRSYWLNRGVPMTIEEVETRFYMVLKVLDQPGVLAKIAGEFGSNRVSLESVVQKGIGDRAQIVLITHRVKERNFRAAREGLEKLDVVIEIPSVIRVESDD